MRRTQPRGRWTCQIKVCLSEEMCAQLQQCAADEHVAPATLARRVIARFLADVERGEVVADG